MEFPSGRNPVRLASWLGCAALGIGALLFFQRYVPLDMDEIVYYSSIGWWRFPYNVGYLGWPGGWNFDLSLFGHWWPLRSYYYVGSLQSLIYYPLNWLFPYFWSARALGVFFLAAEAAVLSRFTKLSGAGLFVGLLLFFPFSYQHLADGGPLALHCLLVFVIVMLIELDFLSRPRTMAAVIGVLMFLGVWEKLSFVWLIPGLALWTAIRTTTWLKEKKVSWRTVLLSTLIAFLMGGVPSLVLLFAGDRVAGAYYRVPQFFPQEPRPWTEKVGLLSRCIFNALETAERVIPVNNYDLVPWIALGTLTVAVLVAIVLWGYRRALARAMEPGLGERAILIPGGVLLFLLAFFAMTTKAYAMHHVVLAYPFLIISVAVAMKFLWTDERARVRLGGVGLLGFLFLLYAPCWARLVNQRPPQEDDPVRLAIHEKLQDKRLATDYAYIILDWGYFHLQWVFGDENQMVIGLEQLRDPQLVGQLKALLRSRGRKALFISMAPNSSSDLAMLSREFQLEKMPGLPDDARWQVLMEPRR